MINRLKIDPEVVPDLVRERAFDFQMESVFCFLRAAAVGRSRTRPADSRQRDRAVVGRRAGAVPEPVSAVR